MSGTVDIAAEPTFITVTELAARLRMSKKFIERHAQAGRIPGLKRFGRLVRFDRHAIEKALLKEEFLLPDPRSERR